MVISTIHFHFFDIEKERLNRLYHRFLTLVETTMHRKEKERVILSKFYSILLSPNPTMERHPMVAF